MDTRQRIIEIFEVISHQQIGWTAKGSSTEAGAICLESVQLLLEPRLHGLRQQVDQIHKQNGITDARIESLRAVEAVTAYVIGILSGLDLCGRPEIAGRFATLYASEGKRAVDSLFTHQTNVREFARRAN